MIRPSVRALRSVETRGWKAKVAASKLWISALGAYMSSPKNGDLHWDV